MGTRRSSVIMLLTGGVIGPLTCMFIGTLAVGRTGIGADTLDAVYMTVVVLGA